MGQGPEETGERRNAGYYRQLVNTIEVLGMDRNKIVLLVIPLRPIQTTRTMR